MDERMNARRQHMVCRPVKKQRKLMEAVCDPVIYHLAEPQGHPLLRELDNKVTSHKRPERCRSDACKIDHACHSIIQYVSVWPTTKKPRPSYSARAAAFVRSTERAIPRSTAAASCCHARTTCVAMCCRRCSAATAMSTQCQAGPLRSRTAHPTGQPSSRMSCSHAAGYCAR